MGRRVDEAMDRSLAVMNVGCAFCSFVMTIHVNNNAPGRNTRLANIKCSNCDSIFEIWLQTKRRSKGRRFKATEKIAADKIGAAIAAARAKNDKLALEMLAEPGCTCGNAEWRQHAALYGHERRDGLESGGTGRDGIPLTPRHGSRCPVREKQERKS